MRLHFRVIWVTLMKEQIFIGPVFISPTSFPRESFRDFLAINFTYIIYSLYDDAFYEKIVR